MMSDLPNIGSELSPADQAFVAGLQTRLAIPTPTFRGALASRIESLDPGYGPRPEHLWVKSGALFALGLLLIVIALLV
jgi:hypothetical protein